MVEVGIRVPHAVLERDAAALRDFAAAVDESAIDRAWVGDHVSFKGGQGYDGLLQAMAIAALTSRVTVQTAVYLLPLRHPVPVARQVSSIAQIAPDRFVFGVGVGGDDPAEVRSCGVDPRTRGRRMDESLAVVGRLLAGETIDHQGEHFSLTETRIRPVPEPRVPIVVGGRAPAALARAGRLGDGWLGVFVTPERFTEGIAAVDVAAEAAGRVDVAWQHGLLAWCGFGRSPAAEMEALYRQPYERFARYAPYGSPDDVAAALRPFVAAGARTVLLAAVADDPDDVIAGAARVRTMLQEGG